MATSDRARWTGALLSTLLACLVAPARAQTEAELASAPWVEGRVRFPPGAPPDEQCFVVARGLRFDEGGWHRAAVTPDGSFRVAFHPRSRRGWLMLEARRRP